MRVCSLDDAHARNSSHRRWSLPSGCSSAAAGLGLGNRRAAQRVARLVVDLGGALAKGVAVLEDGVDLPRAVRAVDPDLVLLREATGAGLLDGVDALVGESLLVGPDGVAVLDLE